MLPGGVLTKTLQTAFWRRLCARFGGLRPQAAGPETVGAPPDTAELEQKLGHRFASPELLQQALLHRSHGLVTRNRREDSNERLEFLGDAVLGLVVNDHLYAHFPETSEGDLTKMKSLLVCRDYLADAAGRLGLGAHIRMSRSEAATGGRSRASILADATEAVIGAVYLDGGLAGARQVIRRWLLAGCEDVLASRSQENYKSRLQEVIQARHKSPPRYRITGCEGPDHARLFKVSVSFDGRLLGEGYGPSKKIAEQAAARQALAGLADCGDLQEEDGSTAEE